MYVGVVGTTIVSLLSGAQVWMPVPGSLCECCVCECVCVGPMWMPVRKRPWCLCVFVVFVCDVGTLLLSLLWLF